DVFAVSETSEGSGCPADITSGDSRFDMPDGSYSPDPGGVYLKESYPLGSLFPADRGDLPASFWNVFPAEEAEQANYVVGSNQGSLSASGVPGGPVDNWFYHGEVTEVLSGEVSAEQSFLDAVAGTNWVETSNTEATTSVTWENNPENPREWTGSQ